MLLWKLWVLAEVFLCPKQLFGPLVLVGMEPMGLGGDLSRRAVPISRDLTHGRWQRAAVSAGPAVCGLAVGLLIAAEALMPLSQNMNREPALAPRALLRVSGEMVAGGKSGYVQPGGGAQVSAGQRGRVWVGVWLGELVPVAITMGHRGRGRRRRRRGETGLSAGVPRALCTFP